jgi:hypothetical protein
MSELEALKFNLRGLPVLVVNPSFPFGGGDIAPTPTGILVQRFAYGQSPVVLDRRHQRRARRRRGQGRLAGGAARAAQASATSSATST